MPRPSAILAIIFTAMLLAPPPHQATASCFSHDEDLSPCLKYFKGGGGTAPSAKCCDGMRTVVAKAETGVHRRLICTCLKSMASRVSGATVELAGGLPAKCGVAVPFEISPKTDCDKVQ